MNEPIAIVGSFCRFPGGASSPSKLWELLRAPKDVLTEFPPERLNLSSFYNKIGDHHGTTDVPNKSYLLTEDHRLFDASFFNINPMEADSMDPQQRLLLETVYEAFECAGYTIAQMQETLTSVFVGAMTGDYYDIQLRDTEVLPRYHATGTARSILSNRISYFFNLTGPSMTIDTACSSSLVALHQAVLSLRNGDSKYAVVAGANILLDPTMYIAESKLHMLSPTARSRMWDKFADGYARGEGFAAIMLKPLSVALKDGDHIECLVRGSSVNSDGRTTGITMPSASAQAALIRRTYQAAGLDCIRDRPQFFECHGTGTQAGDPVEAQAIQETFFPESSVAELDSDDKLWVGSIKTIIGHLEGCAGLAGILNASLAIQNRCIPPNMHFKELNPKVEPFYNHLQIPTKPVPWPATSNAPMRASVNSFGFGGTNAHVILESYEPDRHEREAVVEDGKDAFVGPLVLSANSQSSLLAHVKEVASYLNTNPPIDLRDVSWMFQEKRSTFPIRTFFSGATRDDLLRYMDKAIETAEDGPGSYIGTAPNVHDSSYEFGILGIFTGQGAQWAKMGSELIKSSRVFRESIERCEDALASLSDGPEWSLKAELLAEESQSRLSEAALSQPLCSALQIAMVDLAATAGVKFNAVVGHSSGEIAATYAAGIISATDAIRIAYYRGLYAKLARGAEGKSGSMMAVGLSFDEASAFCSRSLFAGRIGVAASNSSNSITLSGDVDAIEEAKEILDAEKTFARKLVVDTAYHSHHMLKCSEAYLASLARCDIQISEPREGCVWVSSVRGDAELLDQSLESLKGQYWVDNMVKPVLFSQAVECSLWAGGPFDIVLEMGPHPALKGPTTQTLKSSLGSSLPYVGMMRRATNDVEAFSGGIGYIWSYLGDAVIDFSGYRQAFDARQPQMLKNLPSYSWDHERLYWQESRISRRYRLRKDEPQILLGRRAADDSEYDLRWQNVLRLNELPWLKDHVFQGQALFPAAGYLSMAIEAAGQIAGERTISVIEVEDLVVPRALVIEDDQKGVETSFAVKRISNSDDSVFIADFVCYSCPLGTNGTLEKTCGGRLTVSFGEPSLDELPPRSSGNQQLSPINVERFYDRLLSLGLNYQGAFRATTSAHRRANCANTLASWDRSSIGDEYMIHPAIIDIAFQSVFAAIASPETDTLWSPYLPIGIRRLSFNPSISFGATDEDAVSSMVSFLTESSVSLIEGDIHVSNQEGKVGVQIEGLRLKSFTEPNASSDRVLFSEQVWDLDISAGFDGLIEEEQDVDEVQLVDAIDRTALHYFQSVFSPLTEADISQLQWHFQSMSEAVHEIIASIQKGQHPTAKKEWLNDSRASILALKQKYERQIDLQLIHAISENLPAILRSETQLLEVMLENDMLNRLYMEGRSFVPLNKYIARVAKKVTFKHPRMKILEIGAGTGGTTRSVLDSIGNTYASYTYTDISSGFFEKAADKFADHRSKINFRVLDIEKDIAEQGFEEHSYDTIIAANVLHATRTLEVTMQHVRRLLKPGGFLILMEVTGELLVLPFVMGGLPGWWLGADDGRIRSPGISPVKWDSLLRSTGFSGVDKVLHDVPDAVKHSCSVIISQAVDENFELLRDPLSSPLSILGKEPILIIGGKTLVGSKLLRDTLKLLAPWKIQTRVIDSLENLTNNDLASTTSVICLQELDRPVFSDSVTMERIKTLQNLFTRSTNILWVTTGRLAENPHCNMTVGVGRAVVAEIPLINLQFLDIDTPRSLDARTLLEAFLRLVVSNSSEFTQDKIVWTKEPEIALIDGSVYLPRVILNDRLNERFNCQRRAITSKVDVGDIPVEMVASEGAVFLQTKPTIEQSLKEYALLDLHYSIVLPGDKFLCLGSIRATGQKAIAISSSHTSTIQVLLQELFLLETNQDCDPATLLSIANHLIAASLISGVSNTGSTIVYEADSAFAETIERSEQWKGRAIQFAVSNLPATSENCIRIHSRASKNAIKQALPRDTNCFVDLANDASQFIRPVLPRTCSIRSLAQVAWDQETPASLSKGLEQSFYEAISYKPSAISVNTISIMQLEKDGQSSSINYPTVIDWTSSGPVTARIKPFNATNLFSPDKTYFLVGLTSELGLSLCAWMVRSGARHIALTSRNVKVDNNWLLEMQSLGANIKFYRMDVSDRASVHSVHTDICNTMPVIGGVCNAAMVLSDKLFVDMDEDIMNGTLRPKVDGTKHLDELFSRSDLEFFILFSSLGSVVGNGGQSNYHAANLFLESLAAGRRAKGLVASVISIGMVVDVGYVARTGEALIDRLRKLFYMPLSETDIHQLFGEAVMASSSDQAFGADIIMGLQPFIDSPDVKCRPLWYSNPRFSHLIRDAATASTKTRSFSSVANLREQLDNATSEEATAEAIQTSFALKLESMLQLPSNSVNCNVPLLDLGMDSLLAVEIRTWFLKEVHIDVPVLKLLSGDTVTEICGEAARKFLIIKLEKSLAPTDATSDPDKKELSSTNQDSSSDADSSTRSPGEAETPDSSPPKSGSQYWGSASDHRGIECKFSEKDSTTEEPRLIREEDFTRLEKMTAAQSRLWFMQRYQKDATSYNITVSYDIKGDLDVERFHRALTKVVSRHDSLHTCFFEQPRSGKLMQGLLSRSSDCLTILQAKSENDIARELEKYKHRVWNLEQGDTFQATLISKPSGSHLIIFAYHHIIMDGISWHLFLQELNTTYKMLPLSLVKKQCFDFSIDQDRSIENGEFATQLDFWKQKHSPLPDVMPLLPFARVKSRKPSDYNRIHTSVHELGTDQTRKIKQAAQALRVTPFHFYLAAMQVLFSKLLDLEDVCIGVTDANRTVEGYSDTVGFFLNMMALRFKVDRHGKFSELASETAQTAYAASANSSVPFDLVLDKLDIPRSSAHTPLFQVALNYRVGDMAQVSLGDCKLEYSSVEEAKSPYDLAFNITQVQAGTCIIQITSQENLYTPETSQMILEMFVFLVKDLSKDTSLRVAEYSLFDRTSAELSLDVGRGARLDNGWPETLSERVDVIRGRFPNEVAVKDNLGSLAFRELGEQVESIATALLSMNIAAGSFVAVFCESSSKTVATMLAIIRIGCVYVPLDLSLPPARLSVIVKDCQANLIVCQDSTLASAEELRASDASILNISEINGRSGKQVKIRAGATTPAFLLYTSGSTGMPKGILLSQAGFINYLAAKRKFLSLGREVVLQQSSLGFDMSIAQIFNALAHGGTLVIAPRRIRGDPGEIAKLMLAEKVTFTIATPSEYLLWLRYGKEHIPPSWRHACCGGEIVSEQLKKEFRDASATSSPQITDCYGPTEVSAATSFQKVSLAPARSFALDDYPNVGQALPNTSIYIVDENCQLVPRGFPGEICIGGTGLALEYFKQPDLNKTKFLKDPFATSEDVARGWTRMYKTGDRGRLSDDGSLIFMGRKDGDTQIKLRGLRIDLGDVATALLNVADGALSDAIVTIREAPQILVAHVVVTPREELSDSELQSLVRRLPLPQYMHPAMIVRLDRLPTSPNGKTDRKTIEKLPLPPLASEAVGRLSLSEGELRLVWVETLPQAASAPLDAHSDFFMLGGNSFLLVKLQNAIKESIGVRVPLHDLYQSSSLGAMAKLVESGRNQLSPSAEIDWDLETKFESHSSLQYREPRIIKDHDRKVLLTGVSSFLGNAILEWLLSDQRVTKVYCVAVPSDHRDLLPKSKKIVSYTGSLLTRNFGLVESQWTELQSSIDLIIHAGAIGHCLNNYYSMKFPNVESTRSLAQLALTHQVPLHFISSNRVTLLSGHTSTPPTSLKAYRPPTDGSEGLTASKWASEVFLENVADSTQLDVCVHRPCASTGDSAPSDDALNALLRYSTLMKAVPIFENIEGFFDFKNVDRVASDITSEALLVGNRTGASSFKVRHHSSKVRVPVGQIREHMEGIHGCAFEELGLSEWVERATVLGIDGLITSYLEAVVARKEAMLFPYMGEEDISN
jgi:amino acid adenylation domain-containing protein